MSWTIRWRTTSRLVEAHEARPSMPVEDRLEADRGPTAAAGDVDLGDVAGDHGLATRTRCG